MSSKLFERLTEWSTHPVVASLLKTIDKVIKDQVKGPPSDDDHTGVEPDRFGYTKLTLQQMFQESERLVDIKAHAKKLAAQTDAQRAVVPLVELSKPDEETLAEFDERREAIKHAIKDKADHWIYRITEYRASALGDAARAKVWSETYVKPLLADSARCASEAERMHDNLLFILEKFGWIELKGEMCTLLVKPPSAPSLDWDRPAEASDYLTLGKNFVRRKEATYEFINDALKPLIQKNEDAAATGDELPHPELVGIGHLEYKNRVDWTPNKTPAAVPRKRKPKA